MKIRQTNITAYLSFFVGIFAVLVGSMGFLVGHPYISDYFSRIEFNSNTWKQASTSSEGIRVRMIDDLLSAFQLVGKQRSEIVNLLGVPRKTEYSKIMTTFIGWDQSEAFLELIRSGCV